MSNDVSKIITDRIVSQMSAGVIPWKCPYQSFGSRNMFSGREYTGINRVLLTEGFYATLKQILGAEFRVRYEDYRKSSIAIFYSTGYTRKNKETGEAETVSIAPVMRYYQVYSLRQMVNENGSELTPEQSEKIIGKYSKAEVVAGDSALMVTQLIRDYMTRAGIREVISTDTPYYSIQKDEIGMNPLDHFTSASSYVSAFAHEAGHSTGAQSRLKRFTTKMPGRKDDEYAREELVAELTAAFICGKHGIVEELDSQQHAAYIQSWMRNLQEDSRLIISSASKAEKAMQLILG